MCRKVNKTVSFIILQWEDYKAYFLEEGKTINNCFRSSVHAYILKEEKIKIFIHQMFRVPSVLFNIYWNEAETKM